MSEAGARLFEELMRFKPEGLSANAWAVKAGVSRAIWADLRRHGNPSRRTLEKLMAAAGSSLAEFEALREVHSAPWPVIEVAGFAENGRGWRGPPIERLPLLSSIVAGEWEASGTRIELHSIDRSRRDGSVERPASLAADRRAFAIEWTSQAMWPRFRAGRRLIVSPAATVAVGDDVLVALAGDKALIGELVSLSEHKVELRQFNPDLSFSVEEAEIEAIHKVVGEAI